MPRLSRLKRKLYLCTRCNRSLLELVIIDLEEDFRVFDQLDLAESSEASLKRQFTVQVSTNQEIPDVPEGMVLQKRLFFIRLSY